MRFEYAASAVDEVDGALAYYQAIDPVPSSRLVREIEELVRLIQHFLLGWRPLDDGLRQRRLKFFLYVFVYSVRGDLIGMIAFANSHRRPGYWRDRLVSP